jgi:signal transduction histidine kinase
LAADVDLVDRLEKLFAPNRIPREELEWLADCGRLETWETGVVIAPKGIRIETLWIVLSGHIAIRVDRGAGPRRVMEWRTGDVGGLLPYSRMTGPPGDNYPEETTQVLLVHEDLFPEMIRQCPMFTAHTVHIMLDRARAFNTSDLQDEKMISLGKLAAGLAHELNNPASATLRNSKLLLEILTKVDAAARSIGTVGLNGEMLEAIERTREACLTEPRRMMLSPIEQADREDEISDWLSRRNLDPDHAAALAETAVEIDILDALANAASSGETLDAAVGWIAAGCATRALATDIERAATRIYEMVAAVKKFTYMDKLSGPESVDVEAGLRDTVMILASKARSKDVTITMNVESHLPHAYATGGELNQVWFNLIDNALDALSASGHIKISACRELDRIVVRVEDDGPGIPTDIAPHIFDPFFTTKPPGQGTGLGLDIAWRLLRRYHGDLSFDSRPGRTEFRVSLLTEKHDSAPANGPRADSAGT